MRKIKKIAVLLVVLCVATLALSACTKSSNDYVLGTFLQQKISANRPDKIAKAILNDVKSIESILGAEVEGSDIYKINRAKPYAPVQCNDMTIELIKRSKEINKLTNGAYNPCLYSLVKLWKFDPSNFLKGDKEFVPPTDEAIEELLPYATMDNIIVDEVDKTIQRTSDKTMLDLGAIAKGYAVGRANNLMKSMGAKEGFTNLGGNVYTYGRPFKIGIAHPREDSTVLGVISLENMSIATSGDYERYYIYNDIRYCHILNSTTGKPVISDIISVSVIGEDGALCDAMSTSVFALGLVKGEELIRNKGLSAIIVTDDKKIKIIGDIDFQLNTDIKDYTVIR